MRSWLLSLSMLASLSTFSWSQDKRPLDFNRDIRPILSDACFHCHGPDKAKRKADLHLDTQEGAHADRGGYAAIVPGKPDKSAIIERILDKEPSRRMPPPKSGHALKPEQIDLLKRWVAEGGKYEKHWSFIPPVRAELPKVKDTSWPRNPIDYFVLDQLEKEGLKPSPEADRVTLIRRVSLDLTGLPPTPAEVDAFLADKSPDAYDKLVDRLLASPRFGERMAHRWLDAARYADTNGYQTDGDRIMWRWRDWVVEAFNRNMPFDQFTIEQIAGDMLPGATLDQKIATGFNRNHRGNSEGGVIPEEYAVEYVVDRVDTTATVWLGLTAGCAKCHSHKYDPLSQKEFYQLFAYFNNVPERGKAIKYGNSPPYIKSPTREQEIERAKLVGRLKAAEKVWEELEAQAERNKWRAKSFSDNKLPFGSFPFPIAGPWGSIGPPKSEWSYSYMLQHHFPLDSTIEVKGNWGPVYHGFLGMDLVWKGKPSFVPGVRAEAIQIDGSVHLEHPSAGAFGFLDRFTIAVWIKPKEVDNASLVSKMGAMDRSDGYHIALDQGKVAIHLVKRWLDDAIRVETEEIITPDKWHHVAVTYDGSRTAAGIKVYIDGRPAKTKILLDDLNQNFTVDQPLRIGRGGSWSFRGLIDDVHIYDRALSLDEIEVVREPAVISELERLAFEELTQVQKRKLKLHYLLGYGLVDDFRRKCRDAYRQLLDAKEALADFDDALPTTMVMEEMPIPRETHILLRGEYDKKGAKVTAGVPEILPPLPKGKPNNRLGFAYWLVDRSNPLTARVTVNRYWQMLFGTGIVKTVEDFGAQGDWPSHPELLDWLAVEFMEPSKPLSSGTPGERGWGEGEERAPRWDLKHLLKTIVTSATYRQSSRVTKELVTRDPDNRLLARGPRVRLPAEIIRDQALHAAGLLTEKIGGPSIKTYQPPGLVKELHGTDDYVQDHGTSLYRRSLYVYWKRTVPPPGLTTFDAAGREACVVRETRTNTPLQALYLLNDVTNVEAARVLAQRVMKEAPGKEERVRLAFRLATCRLPVKSEEAILLRSLEKHLDQYRANPDAARKLIAMGEYPVPEGVDASELAAYTALANTILNLDEVITKE